MKKKSFYLVPVMVAALFVAGGGPCYEASANGLTVVLPNGGEVVASGYIYPIQWVAPQEAVSFKLKYSIDNGTTWQLIERGITDTSYDWQVPTPRNNKKKCLVKVVGYDDSGAKVGADRSDSTFTIEVLRVTSPNGGETLESGHTHTITWQTNGTKKPVTQVNLNYTENGGKTWNKIDALTENTGTYDWMVPDISTTWCRVKVVLRDARGNKLGRDTSDGDFTIGPPHIPPPDTTPPLVTSTTPNDGASEVIRNYPISVTFDEPVNCLTVTDSTFTLSPAVTGTIDCNGTGATFAPSPPLESNTFYTATITGVEDLAGNAMTTDYTWTFKTGTAIAWAKSYSGGEASSKSIQQTSDGGYIVAGCSSGFTYSYAFWVLKFDAEGNIEWEKAYGGYGDFAYSIEQTTDGGYIVGGFSWYYGTGGSQDAWILKLDSNGNPVWQNSYGGALVAQRPYSIRQTLDGGYIAAGQWYSSDSSDIWVFKLDTAGNLSWQKMYIGPGDQEAMSIQQTTDGGYILAGYSRVGDLLSDVWVLKLDGSGNISWQMAYGDNYIDDRANSVQQTSDGGYIVAGYTNSSGAGGSDVWVLKLDANGDVLWQKTYGGNLDDVANSVQQTSDGGYIIAGDSESFGYIDQGNIWVLKITASGTIDFNPLGGAILTDTTVSGLDSSLAYGITSGTAANTSVSRKITNCAVTNTSAAVKQQAP